ncbi:MAG TPA: endonuclease/exonuclease/phosphatase family protein [Tepidiformaceae bacterium]|nr:endonuclease/exonuclease/phosphatase family protein [Tepidiformaceae bacterium]
MAITICTFNANNLFVRYRFGAVFPGDRSDRSRVENANFGYLPVYDPDLIEIFAPEQRELCAWALTDERQHYPDIIVLQEVESLIALRAFNEMHLDAKYPYSMLIDSRDFRQIDVGVLSRVPITAIRSHVDDIDPAIPGKRLFSRDCLEVQFDIPGNKHLTLFVNHLKSKYSESAEDRARGDALRTRQSERVAAIVRERFPGKSFSTSLFAVVGDCNDEPSSPTVKPFVQDLGMVDALGAIPAEADRWTHWWRSENEVSQLDYLLLSPALATRVGGSPPRIERRGIGYARVLVDGTNGPRKTTFRKGDDDLTGVPVDFQFERFAGITPQLYASDHCPLFLTVP